MSAKEFGWAYVVGSQAAGPKGSIQISGDGTKLDYDPNLLWSDADNALHVSGNIVAYNFEIQNQTETVYHFSTTGSSVFGDTGDDFHRFTGSLGITGDVTATNHYGWGGDLDGVPVNYYTNPGAQKLITSTDARTVNGEDNLTFDGNLLNISGDLQALEVDASQVSSSVALFGEADVRDLEALTFTDGALTMQTGSISNVGHLQATTMDGTLMTPSQPNITQVGILNSLEVANDATINGTLYVKSANNRIGINVQDPAATSEVKSDTNQLRLTSQREIFGVQSAQHTDLSTNSNGHFSINSTSGFVGINKDNPTVALDVLGDALVSGNLTINGTLSAKVTDFVVSANTLTLGDEASDTIVSNAGTLTAPNGLTINNDLFVQSDSVGVGATASTHKFEIQSNSDQFKIGTQSNSLTFNVSNNTTTIGASTGGIDFTSAARILNSLHVGANQDISLNNIGEVSSSVSVSSKDGFFTNVTSDTIVNGSTTITSGAVNSLEITATTINGTNINGTILTPQQTSITDLGNLNNLSVINNTNLGGNLAIGISAANKKVEIKDTSAQLRLTNTEHIFGISEYKYSDLKTTGAGDLSLMPSSGKVIAPSLQLTSVPTQNSNHYLSLDANGNVIFSPNIQHSIEVRNRVVVTGDHQADSLDYFIGVQAAQNLDILLPDASTMMNGQIVVIKDELQNADTFTITISARPNQLVENRQVVTLTSPGSSINLYTDGISKFFTM